MSTTIPGSCLCGTVTYEVRAPFQRMVHCHCSRCRKASGVGHATNLMAGADQLTWLTGERDIGRYDLPTAPRFGKWFCRHCGSPVPRVLADLGIAVIPAGSLDAPPGIQPSRHIFWGSRVEWGCDSGGLPTHADYPDAW